MNWTATIEAGLPYVLGFLVLVVIFSLLPKDIREWFFVVVFFLVIIAAILLLVIGASILVGIVICGGLCSLG